MPSERTTATNPAIAAMRQRIETLRSNIRNYVRNRDRKQREVDQWEAMRVKAQVEIDSTLEAIELLEKAAEFPRGVTLAAMRVAQIGPPVASSRAQTTSSLPWLLMP